MTHPRILVTAAAGHTGAAVVRQLLEAGVPVRAAVRRADARSEALRRLGAEVVVGDLADADDVRRSLDGVRRAYYCAPFSPDALGASVLFAAAAEDARLEAVTVLTQWLADPASPSPMTRAHWLADRAFAASSVPTVTVNPGWFADNYRLAGLDVVARTGVFALPLGDGLNAPPSNEDIARVVVGTLVAPDRHAGQTYRPTGPRLLSPPEIAEAFGRALGRPVRYVDGPRTFFAKAGRASGLSDYTVAQLFTYLEEYRRGTFGIGAPTDAVREVGGRAPEDVDTIARRYVADEANVMRGARGALRTAGLVARALRTRRLDPAAYHRRLGVPPPPHTRFAGESAEWRAGHDRKAAGEPPARLDPVARAG